MKLAAAEEATVASHEASAQPAGATDGPADESAGSAVRSRRYSRMSLALIILAVIALVAALYLARTFFVPLLIGILVSYTLSPVVDWLRTLHIPRPVAAAIVVAALVGGLSWTAYSLSDQATVMIEKLPDAARKLRQNLSAARTGNPTALQNMQEAANELQAAAADAGAKPGEHVITTTRESEPTAWLRNYAVAQSALLFAVAGQAPIVVLLAYFVLASGGHFRRKLLQFVGPSLARKKDALRILEEIDVQVQRYLLLTLASNAVVAVATWLAFEAMGMEQAGVWGVFAGVLRFVPYLGPLLVAIAAGVAGFLQFGTLLHALAVAGAALLIASVIGLVFTTWLQGRLARVNAAVLFIALLFFGWLWGIAGLLLGAPLLAIAKVICDRVDSLKPAGELLGR